MPFCGEVAIHLCGCNLNGFVGREAGCGFTHGGEHHRQMLVELLLEESRMFFLMFVDFVPKRLALVKRQVFYFRADFCGCVFIGFYCLGDCLAHFIDFASELIVGEVFQCRADGVDFVYDGFDLFEVALRLVAKELT